ncbi:hypothetical protein HAX54_023358, partial [Datura stramonium]|nr:hypothetical protein [Datura stramonium]
MVEYLIRSEFEDCKTLGGSWDFNFVLRSEDRIGGNPVSWSEVTDFSILYRQLWFDGNDTYKTE